MTQEHIPDQMTVVVLDSYSGVEALRVERRPVPKPGKDEVFVKVAAAPINPSDIAFLHGRYGFKSPLPTTPGGECSGTVVAAGPGIAGRYFLGKRVACMPQGEGDGVWAEYVVKSTRGGALPLHDSVSMEQGAMSAINPLTALAFLDIAKNGGHKAILLTAAASALGQMVNRLCQKNGVQVINIVRRDTDVDLLKRQGAKVILNSNDVDFIQQLRNVCHQYEARLAFDAVAGPLTAQLLEAMPHHSKVTIYGGLSFKEVQASPDHIIFEGKSIDGFWLGPWLANKNLIQILLTWRRAQKLLGAELKTDVRARYPFQEAKEAVQEYLDQMTGGKILLIPNQ